LDGSTYYLELEHFLRNELAFNILPSDILLLDYAGVFSSVDVRTARNDVMHDNWDYKSEYS
jgi:hypothetical protein